MSAAGAPSPTTTQCGCETHPKHSCGEQSVAAGRTEPGSRTRLAKAVDTLSGLQRREGWTGVGVRVALVAVLALAAAAIHIPRPATVCPLRALTGIPCPLCGSTTAAVEIGSGDIVGALRANPVAVAVGGLWLLGPLGLSRMWWSLGGRRHLQAIGAILAVGWVWQLFRFDLL